MAPEIGVRVRTMPGDPRPFRSRTGEKQPCVQIRAALCLEIVHPVEATGAQDAAQRKPSQNIERPRPPIDGDVVKEAALLTQGGKSRGGKQGDLVGAVVPADRRRGPERLNKVTKGAQFNDKDLAPLRQRKGICAARAKFRQSPEIDEPRE